MWIGTMWVRWKEPENPDISLKGPTQTYSLTDTHPGLQQRVSSSEVTRDAQGKTRSRTGVITAIVPLLCNTLGQSANGQYLACVEPSPNMTNSESALAW